MHQNSKDNLFVKLNKNVFSGLDISPYPYHAKSKYKYLNIQTASRRNGPNVHNLLLRGRVSWKRAFGKATGEQSPLHISPISSTKMPLRRRVERSAGLCYLMNLQLQRYLREEKKQKHSLLCGLDKVMQDGQIHLTAF